MLQHFHHLLDRDIVLAVLVADESVYLYGSVKNLPQHTEEQLWLQKG
jgi:hypothetical protein